MMWEEGISVPLTLEQALVLGQAVSELGRNRIVSTHRAVP